jgi:hypothetical protein
VGDDPGGAGDLDLPLTIPPLEVWLTSHRELYTARRIRAIYDRLGELMSDWLGKPGAFDGAAK